MNDCGKGSLTTESCELVLIQAPKGGDKTLPELAPLPSEVA